jgi:hypothetical protein
LSSSGCYQNLQAGINPDKATASKKSLKKLIGYFVIIV